LPTNTWKITTLSDFLQEIDSLPDTEDTKKFFLSLTSQSDDTKFTFTGNKETILEQIAQLPKDDYVATVKTIYEDLY